jgi:hypothetical protein
MKLNGHCCGTSSRLRSFDKAGRLARQADLHHDAEAARRAIELVAFQVFIKATALGCTFHPHQLPVAGRHFYLQASFQKFSFSED